MVEKQDRPLDQLFHALSDRTRRLMLQQLANSPCSVSDLAAPFTMSLAAASKHIKVLENAGLIRRQIEGRTHICRLNAQPLHAGLEWIAHYEQFWRQRLDVLAGLLAADSDQKGNDNE
jgi:DNA-binding transcriptional ArsR family regulator